MFLRCFFQIMHIFKGGFEVGLSVGSCLFTSFQLWKKFSDINNTSWKGNKIMHFLLSNCGNEVFDQNFTFRHTLRSETSILMMCIIFVEKRVSIFRSKNPLWIYLWILRNKCETLLSYDKHIFGGMQNEKSS